METQNNATKSAAAGKPRYKTGTDSLRVKKETKRKIQAEIAALNKKEFGRPVTADQYVCLAITLLRPEHTQLLQEQSLTAKDRFERRYAEYCRENGKVSKDEFLGLLLKD